jgi:hypothetical protein
MSVRTATTMNESFLSVVHRLDQRLVRDADVIPWSSPVLSFGDVASATVATLGLNPSKREFVDETGRELEGASRRLHTLHSLNLSRWSDAEQDHLDAIRVACSAYFLNQPYHGWFGALDRLISGTGTSFYSVASHACHLDLIPYATNTRWADLTKSQRDALMWTSRDTLGLLLRDSAVRLLVLNGITVVHNLQKLAGVTFKCEEMPDWTLPRQRGGIRGLAFEGAVVQIGGVALGRPVRVLGYNHNIQSSFGVTTGVKAAIQEWIALRFQEMGL